MPTTTVDVDHVRGQELLPYLHSDSHPDLLSLFQKGPNTEVQKLTPGQVGATPIAIFVCQEDGLITLINENSSDDAWDYVKNQIPDSWYGLKVLLLPDDTTVTLPNEYKGGDYPSTTSHTESYEQYKLAVASAKELAVATGIDVPTIIQMLGGYG